MPREIKVVSETVAAPAQQVYEFARRRENLRRWASGLAANDIEQEGDHWVVTDSPLGRTRSAWRRATTSACWITT